MARYPIEALLRPPVELTTAIAAASASLVAFSAPSLLLMTPGVANASAVVLLALALLRAWQARRVIRYQRGLRRLPRYPLAPEAIPRAKGLFLGRGFQWTSTHTQRLWDAGRKENARFLRPGPRERLARRLERSFPALTPIASALAPARNAFGYGPLHGVGLLEGEHNVVLPDVERQANALVIGTTGVGKTRLAELAITQDIRDGHAVIAMDPKGDPDLFRRMAAEVKRAGRAFYFFHLGFPESSARYNPIGRFSRVTEVATRIANQLQSGGNAEAFRQFAWLFTNNIARALIALGRRPDYRAIQRYMSDIDPLLIEYLEHYFDAAIPEWRTSPGEITDRGVPAHLKGRTPRALELLALYRARGLYDDVAEGLKRAFEYEKTFFDKISTAVKPLLDKLLTGEIGGLVNPDYGDASDTRPILDWETVIRRRAIVYCGFDALTDPEIAAVVGQSMIADLVALAGELYKHGAGEGSPTQESLPVVRLHLDEIAELAHGPEIVQALNKGRGAGLQHVLYGQSLADFPAGLRDKHRADQLLGNVNTIVMMAVSNAETAKFLTDRLGECEVNQLVLLSGATDSSSVSDDVHFTSSTQERITSQTVPLLDPGHLIRLPRGHAFVHMSGGALYKVRMPELSSSSRRLPAEVTRIADEMARRYTRSLAMADVQVPDSIDYAAVRGAYA